MSNTSEQPKPDATNLKTFAQFYPFYLNEHSNQTCRRLHFVGSSLALICLFTALFSGRSIFFAYAAFCGYGFAWLGHFAFEKNKPASFKRPLFSFMGDWVMYKDIWTGKIKF